MLSAQEVFGTCQQLKVDILCFINVLLPTSLSDITWLVNGQIFGHTFFDENNVLM